MAWIDPLTDVSEPQALLGRTHGDRKALIKAEALRCCIGAVAVSDTATDAPDGWVGKVRREQPDRIGTEHAGRVGEDDDFAGSGRDRAVERMRLAAAIVASKELNAAIGKRAGDLIGSISRTIGGDPDFQLFGRVVEREGLADLFGENGFFVVGGDDKADRGGKLVRPGHAAAKAGEQQGNQRIAEQRVGNGAAEPPEKPIHDRHDSAAGACSFAGGFGGLPRRGRKPATRGRRRRRDLEAGRGSRA